MEKNESHSMKMMENQQSSNGRMSVGNENRDERTNVELSCKKSCLVSNVTEVGSGSLGGTTNSANSNSHKMGSRRIFTPQFKLQVLESYRNDNDCKGNQRATARKYNIHRRQIQKWLQCESSLRSSVANINQNTVKHQFHNISIHQQQTHKSSIPTAASMISVPYGTTSQHTHLGLDATRSEAQHSAIIVPSLSTGVTTSSTQTQGVFSAANLAAVVAAAAGAAMTITSPPSNGTSGPNESVASPLRPSTIIGASSNNPTATMSPLLHHHHHHYGIPPYIHTPASVQLPVSILTHHISHPQHIHQQAQQHQPYQYHNLAYTQALTHQSDKQQSSFLSSISLPDVNALSAAASLATTGNGYSVGETEHSDSVESVHSVSKTISEHPLDNANSEQGCDHKVTYHPKTINPSLYEFNEGGYPLLYPPGPMDLSLRTRRNIKAELLSTGKNPGVSPRNSESDSRIVDLTHRKRKVSSTSNNTVEQQTGLCEKQLKLKNATDDNSYGANTNSDEEEVEIEVGTEEKLPPSKPVKLFKPYLLDDDADTDNSTPSSCRSAEIKYGGESGDSSPWLRYATNLSPPPRCYNMSGSCQGTTFQYSLKDNFTTPAENSNFPPEAKTESSKSAFTSIPTISPTSFRCPKGSPSSSGYESSSSTYSDSSFSSRGESFAFNRTYSINLQMHAIHNENIILHPSKHVERWLEQETRHPSEPNSPIAILA